MAPPSEIDKRYLELHGSRWRVVVNVPKELHAKLGRKLRRPLNTDSLREANKLKWDIVADLKQQLYEAAHPEEVKLEKMRKALQQYTKESVLAEANHVREYLKAIIDEDERAELIDAINMRADTIRGMPKDYDPDTNTYFFDKDREQRASEYLGVSQGKMTPIDRDHETFIKAMKLKKRTQDDDRRSLRLLLDWCEDQKIPPYIENITNKVAVKFSDALPSLKPDLTPITLNKIISRLSVYWRWLVKRHEAELNVWIGRRLNEPKETTDTQERAFTDAEMVALLTGPATQQMHDLMRIAALSGARLDAIVSLKVKDCEDGYFLFKPQKKEPGSRLCPIHSALSEIIKRRTEGKSPEDDLFPEWPSPKSENSLRERSFKASNHFTEYRRSIGVEVQLEGKRRSLVNFHSFRRWFITKAEQADQPEHLIAAVVGHKRKGITLGRYSAGPLLAQAERVVESVRLPTPEDLKKAPKRSML